MSPTPGMKIFKFAADQSGFMVPPGEPTFVDLFGPNFVFPKTPAYFRSVMGPLQRIFRSPRHLASLTLGALGNLIEFTIHNPMHVRWASLPHDPGTGAVAVREAYDFDEKWDDPRYDFLGEFYSSHVNPLFWRLHGWVDDRIEDWYQAQEAASPGEIERSDHQGVPWFTPGTRVQAADPFDWPGSGHDHHDHGDDHAIAIMLEVLEIIRKAEERAAARTGPPTGRRPGPFAGVMNFVRWIEPAIMEEPRCRLAACRSGCPAGHRAEPIGGRPKVRFQPPPRERTGSRVDGWVSTRTRCGNWLLSTRCSAAWDHLSLARWMASLARLNSSGGTPFGGFSHPPRSRGLEFRSPSKSSPT